MSDVIVAHYNVPTKDITHIYFHPVVEKVLISSSSEGLLLYGIEKKNRPFIFQAERFHPIAGFILPKEDAVIGASTEGKIALWKMHNSVPEKLTTGHPSRINGMDLWEYNLFSITCSNDKSIKIWDQSLNFVRSFAAHQSQVTSVACSQGSSRFCSGDGSGTLIYWDANSENQGQIFKTSLGHRSAIISLDFGMDETHISALNELGDLNIIDIRNPEERLRPLKVVSKCARFHPKKPYILASGEPNIPNIYDLSTNSLLFGFEGHHQRITACSWSANGRRFATADSDGTVIVWKTPKTPSPLRMKKAEISSELLFDVPPSSVPLCNISLDSLSYELDMLAAHTSELDKSISAQESRITRLASLYPSLGGLTSYDC